MQVDYTVTINEQGFSEIRIDKTSGKRSLFSNKTFSVGDIVCNFYWQEILEQPSYLTVQIGEEQHIILQPTYLECVNHSCDPNVFFNTATKELICLQPIKVGDEFTFFYPSAEWDMDQSFECHCETSSCIGFVRGAKYLSEAQIKNYRFTDFIQQKLRSK